MKYERGLAALEFAVFGVVGLVMVVGGGGASLLEALLCTNVVVIFFRMHRDIMEGGAAL